MDGMASDRIVVFWNELSFHIADTPMKLTHSITGITSAPAILLSSNFSSQTLVIWAVPPFTILTAC
jgi:hypothetical protein